MTAEALGKLNETQERMMSEIMSLTERQAAFEQSVSEQSSSAQHEIQGT